MSIENSSKEHEDKALSQDAVSRCLYAFRYCSCIYESSWFTMSLHYSREGAEKAMNEHKNEELKKWNEMFEFDNEISFKFGDSEGWDIQEVEVLP
jgi:hypothetical protein